MMSALPPKADIHCGNRNVSFGPILLQNAKDHRAVSDDARHHWQLGSVLLPSVPREVLAPVCGRLSTVVSRT
jgi:hypothetical protein